MAWWTSNKLVCAALLVASTATAEPLRLRGDALATAQAPAGLVTLEGSDRAQPWLDAEASVWFGAGDDTQANALVIVVRVRDPKRRGTLALGRQVVVAGALRPIHLDGGRAIVRLPLHQTFEAFGGVPVVPSWGPRSWDWVTGARFAQQIDQASIGVGWMQQRDHGEIATHELALDAAVPIGQRVDLGGGAALDVIDVGLAEARMSATLRGKVQRVELFATRRAPSHLLPATSLFSVLGDVPATRTGAAWKWRAAPRLDVDATAAIRIADPEPTDPGAIVVGASVREDLEAGARLRLDDRGRSSLGLELRRQGAPDGGGWSGARGMGHLELAGAWATSAEVELVVPDDRSRGSVWPWALGAITWRSAAGWDVAGAVEASATPQYRSRVDALLRLSHTWDVAQRQVARSGALAKRGTP